MTNFQRIQKKNFDFVCSFLGLACLWWLILLAAFAAYLDTGLSGFFKQKRIGENGKLISVFKIRSMRNISGIVTTVTTDKDPRISFIGRFLRKTKIDELPQLWNVLRGTMSLVGPRPDVPGFADALEGEDRIILTVRPGITGLASLFFHNEEELLAKEENPEEYSRKVIWPEKVRLNKSYIQNYSFWLDLKLIWKTVVH
jgi:lipopolysaccharide/colanic/teichoic acid biosynthesis glycosyltransferase